MHPAADRRRRREPGCERSRVFDVGRPGLTLVDIAPDVTVDEIRAKTEAEFAVHPNLT